MHAEQAGAQNAGGLIDIDVWSTPALGSARIDFDALNRTDFYAIAAARAGVEEFLFWHRAGGTKPNARHGSKCGSRIGGRIILLGSGDFSVKGIDLADHFIQRAAGLNQRAEQLAKALPEKIAAV